MGRMESQACPIRNGFFQACQTGTRSRNKETETAENKPARQHAGNDQKKELAKVKTVFKATRRKLEDLTGRKESLEKALADPDIYSNRSKFLETESQYNQAKKNGKKPIRSMKKFLRRWWS